MKLKELFDTLLRAIKNGETKALNIAIFLAHFAFFPLCLVMLAFASDDSWTKTSHYLGWRFYGEVWFLCLTFTTLTGISLKKYGLSDSRIVRWSVAPFMFFTMISNVALGIFIIPFVAFATAIVSLGVYGPFGIPTGILQFIVSIAFLAWYVSIDFPSDEGNVSKAE